MKLILLTRGQWTKVDDQRYEELSKWNWYADWNRTNRSFYAARQERGVDGKQHKIRMHRYLLGAPRGVQVDHKNHDTLDNQAKNLRLATDLQNRWNRKMSKQNKSGYIGVSFRSDCRKHPWCAQIRVNGKSKNLGHYKTPQEAHNAYARAAIELRGEFAKT